MTKGEELRKIKKGLAGILDILVKEQPIITPKIVAKVAESEAILTLIRKASIICSFSNNFPYHFKENPFHNITLLFSLNEQAIKVKIGKQRNINPIAKVNIFKSDLFIFEIVLSKH